MAFRAVAVAGRHQKSIRQAIVGWKFSKRMAVQPVLVDLLVQSLSRQSWSGSFEAFVPIPQPWSRWLHRRFFWPTYELAAEMSQRTGIPVWPVVSAREHRPQVGLTRAERLQNIRRAFYVADRIDLTGRRVCLVDDVMTTGATLHTAAKVLKRAGASEVWALAIARTQPNQDV